jgi:hypothetical protein
VEGDLRQGLIGSIFCYILLVDDDLDPMAFDFLSQTFLLAPDLPLFAVFLPGK